MRRPRRIYRMSKIKESKNLQNVKNKRIEEFTDCQKQKNRRIYRLSKIKKSKNLQNVKNKRIEEFTDCQKQKKPKNLQNLKYHHEGLILTLVSSIYCSILSMVSSSSSTCTFSSCISTLGSFSVVFFPRFGVDIFLCGIFYF